MTMFNNITNGIIYIFNTRILHTLAIHCNIPFPYLLFIYLLHIIFGCSFFSFKIPSRKSSSIYILYIHIYLFYNILHLHQYKYIYIHAYIYIRVCVYTYGYNDHGRSIFIVLVHQFVYPMYCNLITFQLNQHVLKPFYDNNICLNLTHQVLDILTYWNWSNPNMFPICYL